MIKKDQIIEILKTCNDPEIPIDLWNLGLIYNIDINQETKTVNIKNAILGSKKISCNFLSIII